MKHFVIPGPELVIWWGVPVPLLSAVLGIVGVLVGHWMAPVIGAPLSLGRQIAVIVGGVLLVLGIAMATGQKPLLVLSWAMGIGFSGITIFQTMGAQSRAALTALGELILAKLNLAKRIDEDSSDKDPAP